MKPASFLYLGATALLAWGLGVRSGPSAAAPPARGTSPIYGVAIPEGYRGWTMIAPATEEAPFDELRVVVGNPIAADAFRRKIRPFPDGAVLVKLAWKRQRSPDFASAMVPGEPTTVQVMEKDSRRYRDSGGWGFGRFVDARPVDDAQHRTCFACHDAKVRDRDWVFTRYAH